MLGGGGHHPHGVRCLCRGSRNVHVHVLVGSVFVANRRQIVAELRLELLPDAAEEPVDVVGCVERRNELRGVAELGLCPQHYSSED